MDVLHAFILGTVEGITEFLPISSTGHLILASRFLGLDSSEFLKSFEIIIQLGAILAVVALYWQKLILNRQVLKRVLTAFFPTALVGLMFYKLIKNVFLGNAHIVIWSLFIGGLFLIIFELIYRNKKHTVGQLENISYRDAFLIGVCQSIALIPGVSRAAATIVGGMMLGVNRYTIVEFSFLLAVPTMLAAAGLDLVKNINSFSGDQWIVLAVGFIISFVIAVVSIKFLLHFIKSHDFIPFGVYRIFIALIFWKWI